jgi:hypothetical protein
LETIRSTTVKSRSNLRHVSFRAFALLLAGSSLMAVSSAHAATYTWSNLNNATPVTTGSELHGSNGTMTTTHFPAPRSSHELSQWLSSQ